jgi:CDP-diacylglycerol--serine O-phosphatidyltransferase
MERYSYELPLVQIIRQNGNCGFGNHGLEEVAINVLRVPMTDQDSETSPEQENVLPIDEHEEIVSEGGKKVRRRGIYLLPNLLTLSALFAGFYAIIAGMSGDFNEAGWAIMIAAICDGLDGRIARLTNTQSEFGAQFDSLSDMVSFGVAPSLIMFSWGFGSLDRVGWAASFVFVSCAAIRLARFNVQLGTADKRFFVGLQSPLAAGIVTFVPWVAHKYGAQSDREEYYGRVLKQKSW